MTEIERKYLVADSSFKEMAREEIEISQGYLNRDPERTVRVRIWGEKGFLTVKGITEGCCRKEFEYGIPHADALELLGLCEEGILRKTRYIVDYEGWKWEIDEYHGRLEGLTVAEIELPAADATYPLPQFIGKEVTGDPSYYNSALKP